MKIAVFTRSCNMEYYSKMVSLLPNDVECHRMTGFDHWSDANTYLEHIIAFSNVMGIDYSINIDEDCFITDWDIVIEIIKVMIGNGKSHAGMPDGGCHVGRLRTYKVQNPFFNIFHPIICKRILDGNYLWFNQESDIAPDFTKMPFEYDKEDYAEPFDEFFKLLYKSGNPLHLYADLHEDGITTILKWNDKTFALHTWYSRDASHRDRILQRFEEAKQLSNGNI